MTAWDNSTSTIAYSYEVLPYTKTLNKLVACTPFPKVHSEKVVKSNFALVEAKVTLQELTVVFQSESLAEGTKVYLRGDAIVNKWVKEVFTVDDKEFILVPESAIQLVVRK